MMMPFNVSRILPSDDMQIMAILSIIIRQASLDIKKEIHKYNCNPGQFRAEAKQILKLSTKRRPLNSRQHFLNHMQLALPRSHVSLLQSKLSLRPLS